MIALILIKVYLKLFDSYTMLGIDNSKINCNKEHRECVATVMFGYKHSKFINSMCT
jgi:hypothetical protein